MQQAAKNHDTTTFDRYFNTDAVFNNVWPRVKSKYATYYAQSGESTFQQSIDLATFTSQASTSKEAYETGAYDFVLGKSESNQRGEAKEGSLSVILQTKPAFAVNDGTASFSLTYANYGVQNPQNYPVYKLTTILQQQADRHWEVMDVQGLEDIFDSPLADNIRLNAIGSIVTNLANNYIIAGQQPYLTNDNWQTVLASYGVQQGATTTFPEDPLSSYGNAYSFAISNSNSLKNYEFVVKANLSTIAGVTNFGAWNGLTYSDVLKDISVGNDIVLGVDCSPPAYCQLEWGNDSAWMQLLKNNTSTGSR